MKIQTLDAFIEIMRATIPVRRKMVVDYLLEGRTDPELIRHLKRFLNTIGEVPDQEGLKLFNLFGDHTARVDVTYETEELKKDIWFFENGEQVFTEHMESINHNFFREVDRGISFLSGLEFNSFISDRDGTVNNYCGRYSTSVQSAYNAIYLARFAAGKTRNPVILTSAPLGNGGLQDISVFPEKVFHYAGSKGREYADKKGREGKFPVDDEKQKVLDALNKDLAKLVGMEKYKIFSRIGSGLQLKFGQTTIARQDIHKSVPEDRSLGFLKKIRSMVADHDPEDVYFRIEDTGLDIEIILTIDKGDEGVKDFDKGDGIDFLDSALDLRLDEGINLICGDTASDIPMVEAAMKKNGETRAIFVTKNSDIQRKVGKLCPHSMFVENPDVLVSLLNQISLI